MAQSSSPSYAGFVGVFKWLYRLPGRIGRSMEKTALASSVVHGEGMGGTQFNLPSVNVALSEIEARGAHEDDAASASRVGKEKK